MLPLPSIPIPDTLKGVDDLIRADFEGFRALWFARLLGATFLVVVGLVMEGPELWHEIHSIVHRWKFKRRFHFSVPEVHTPEWAKLLAFLGWVFIVGGVAGEFVADSFLSRADGYVQKFDEIILAETTKRAGDARDSAKSAGAAATFARSQSEKAVASGLNALNLGTSAKREADSFEQDIVSAKTLAAEAESHLAEALRQVADATAEINRLKSPRSLAEASTLVSALQRFKGMEYTYLGCFSDQESIDLIRQIDNALQLAGWKRTDPPIQGFGDMRLEVFKGFGVPLTVRSGVIVDAESTEPYQSLQARREFLLPLYIQAGIALKHGLAAAVLPVQDDLKSALQVRSGGATKVFIIVGKKP